MRASVIKSDPGFNPEYMGAKVFLDGVQIRRVLTADEDRGFVLVHRVDEAGRLVFTPDRKSVETEYRYGAVRIDLPAPKQPRSLA